MRRKPLPALSAGAPGPNTAQERQSLAQILPFPTAGSFGVSAQIDSVGATWAYFSSEAAKQGFFNTSLKKENTSFHTFNPSKPARKKTVQQGLPVSRERRDRKFPGVAARLPGASDSGLGGGAARSAAEPHPALLLPVSRCPGHRQSAEEGRTI